MLIRNLKKTDIEEAAYVMREAFNYVDQGWGEDDSLAYIQDSLSFNCKLLAIKDEKIVGLLIGHKSSNSLIIDAIGVLPNEMKQGIASSLYAEAEKLAKELNLKDIKMISDPKSAAFKWYKKIGFEANGWVEIEKKI